MSKPRGRPFPDGNTAGRGRPMGSRNKATQVSQALFSDYAGPLTKKCIAQALQGEPGAMRLAMERVCPPQRDRAVEVPLPLVKELADLPVAAEAVMQAVGDGELTPAEGQQTMAMLVQRCNILLKSELEQRLRALEKTVATDQADAHK